MAQSSSVSQGAAIGGGIASGIATYSQAKADAAAQKRQGRFQKMQADAQAKLMEMQAADAIKRGDEQAEMIAKQKAQIIGSQRASMAAAGIEIDSGSAAHVQAATEQMAAEDMLRTRNNAWREAWGFKFQALQTTFEGNMAQLAGNAGAKQTLIAGGMNAINSGISTYGALKPTTLANTDELKLGKPTQMRADNFKFDPSRRNA